MHDSPHIRDPPIGIETVLVQHDENTTGLAFLDQTVVVVVVVVVGEVRKIAIGSWKIFD